MLESSALSGELRSFKGVLPFALATRQMARQLIIPMENANEAALISNTLILPATHLLQVSKFLRGIKLNPSYITTLTGCFL